ncbi:MAG: phospholipase D-like domain-containing protein [Actinomycetota bacterium]
MSTSAQGTVVGGDGVGVAGLTVVLQDVSALFERDLARGVTTSGGAFSLSYAADSSEGDRRVRLRIRVGQHVVKEDERDDVSAGQLSYGQIQLLGKEGTSVLATLGKGEASRLSQGNALEWLCDDVDAWSRVGTLIRNATGRLDVMQLTIDVEKFKTASTEEQPKIVLDFHAPPPSVTQARVVDDNDGRIERLLLAAAKKPNVVVRIQIPVPTVDLHALPFIGLAALVVGLALLSLVAGLIAGLLVLAGAAYVSGKFMKGERHLAKWFTDAGLTDAKMRVRALRTEIYSITHTKLVIEGDNKAILLGSPFEQVYYDSQGHVMDEPRRGDEAGKGPIHDVSVSVRGPAVHDMQEVFNSHWNLADPSDPLTLATQPPQAITTLEPGEFITPVQVVRTLNPRTFADHKDGEKGILEAHLRAIHFAKRWIYFENQYFNDEAITNALIDALTTKTDLQVILLLNIVPDMPHYPMWQRTTVIRLTEAIGEDEAKKRLGVFTSWSHAPHDAFHAKPRLAKHYLHTKTAIIDNNWATVGSANIDGASLDEFQAFWYSKLANVLLEGGAMRNTETNCVVFEETPPAVSAVDALRRRLWAEHLGFVSGGAQNPTDPDLADSTGKDWVGAWNAKADAKAAGLRASPNVSSDIHVLKWPPAQKVRAATSKSHLELLEIPVDPFDLVKDGAPSFDFKTGAFKK